MFFLIDLRSSFFYIISQAHSLGLSHHSLPSSFSAPPSSLFPAFPYSLSLPILHFSLSSLIPPFLLINQPRFSPPLVLCNIGQLASSSFCPSSFIVYSSTVFTFLRSVPTSVSCTPSKRSLCFRHCWCSSGQPRLAHYGLSSAMWTTWAPARFSSLSPPPPFYSIISGSGPHLQLTESPNEASRKNIWIPQSPM